MTYTAADRRKVVDGAYRRRYDLMRYKGIPTSPLPAQPIADHLNRLYDLGWSWEALSRIAGTSDTALLLIAGGDTQTVHRATANAVNNIPHTLNVPDTVPDTCLIPSLGARRRIQALLSLGWTHQQMRAHSGQETTRTAANIYRQTLAAKWRRIDRLYRDLNMTVGPSSKTTIRARDLGYIPPLGWVDIDDPDEIPGDPYRPASKFANSSLEPYDEAVVIRILNGDWRLRCTAADKAEVVARWSQRDPLASHRGRRDEDHDQPSYSYLERLTGWKVDRYVARARGAA